jgi:hypothetical protein
MVGPFEGCQRMSVPYSVLASSGILAIFGLPWLKEGSL